MRIWIRVKVEQFNEEDVEPLKLLTRQIFQQINNFNSSDNRVKVWECDYEQIDKPLKTALLQTGVFVSSILLRVEVETSA
jgi:hypothetical protein